MTPFGPNASHWMGDSSQDAGSGVFSLAGAVKLLMEITAVE
jgi:hypothetical protein